MKQILLFLTVMITVLFRAQTGADITGLVKINSIQTSNTNRILLTDGNGNLGYITLNNLGNAGTVVTTTLNLGVIKTQVAQNAKFRNLPTSAQNRVVTIDSNGSLGYRTFSGLSSSGAISGTLGLNATNLINLTTNIFSSPTSYAYMVVADTNGVLGKRPLSNITQVKDPNIVCSGWGTTGYGGWSAWNGCSRTRDMYQARTCYRLDGSPFTENQTLTDTDGSGCNTASCGNWTDTGVPTWNAWNGQCTRNGTQQIVRTCTRVNGTTFTEYSSRAVTQSNGCDILSCGNWSSSYTNWSCNPSDINSQIRTRTDVRTCTRVNGTTYTETSNTQETKTNQAPEINTTWSVDYRTLVISNGNIFDPDGYITNVTIYWGDGSSNSYNNNVPSQFTHTFSNSNIHAPVNSNVIINVTDNCGRVSTMAQKITTTSKLVNYWYRATQYIYASDGLANSDGATNVWTSFLVYTFNDAISFNARYANFATRGGYGKHGLKIEKYDYTTNTYSTVYEVAPREYWISHPCLGGCSPNNSVFDQHDLLGTSIQVVNPLNYTVTYNYSITDVWNCTSGCTTNFKTYDGLNEYASNTFFKNRPQEHGFSMDFDGNGLTGANPRREIYNWAVVTYQSYEY